MKILVSACLLGENCKYNGGNSFSPAVQEYLRGREYLPVCPELQAGLGCPRIPIEIVDGVLMQKDGTCVDAPLRACIEELLRTLPLDEIECAILQSRSPTCGVNEVYDGTFSGRKIAGSGVFAQALKCAGCRVIDAEDIATLEGEQDVSHTDR